MNELNELLERISQKKKQLDALRPLPPELEKNLYHWSTIALTYNSNAIEGNTLTLAETAQVLEKKTAIGGKKIVDHLETLNHEDAIKFIHTLATQKTRNQLNLQDILAIHEIILQNINNEWAGTLRRMAVRVAGSVIPCPNYMKVPELIDELIISITTSQDHLATIAAYAHLQLVAIHPFVDGNGRTARLLMDLLLLQDNYPLVIIDVNDRTHYINAIQKALQGNTADYYLFIYTTIEQALTEYITAALESEKK